MSHRLRVPLMSHFRLPTGKHMISTVSGRCTPLCHWDPGRTDRTSSAMDTMRMSSRGIRCPKGKGSRRV